MTTNLIKDVEGCTVRSISKWRIRQGNGGENSECKQEEAVVEYAIKIELRI